MAELSDEEGILNDEEGNNIQDGVNRTSERSYCGFTKNQFLIIVVISVLNLTCGTSFALMAPFYPEVASDKGMSKTWIGIVFGIFEITMMFFSLIFGKFIVEIGAKFMTVCGAFIAGVSCILFGTLSFFPYGNVFLVFSLLIRFFQAIGFSGLITASMAIMAAEFPDNLATVIGITEAAYGFGMMIGPSVGGVMEEYSSFYVPFFTIGTIVVFGAIFGIFCLPQPAEVLRPDPNLLRRFVKVPTIYFAGIIVSLMAFSIVFQDPILALYLETLGITNKAIIGVIFLIAPGTYALLSPIFGYISDKFKFWRTQIVVGALIYGVGLLVGAPAGFLGIPLNFRLEAYCIGMPLLGLGIAAMFLPVFPLMKQLAIDEGLPDTLQLFGLVSGFFNTMFSLGAFAGPSISSALSEHYAKADPTTSFSKTCTTVVAFPLMAVLFAGLLTLCQMRGARRRNEAQLQREVAEDINQSIA